jgi:hypothetical protein
MSLAGFFVPLQWPSQRQPDEKCLLIKLNCTPKVGYCSNLWGAFVAKYDESVKLEVVQRYLSESSGAQPKAW